MASSGVVEIFNYVTLVLMILSILGAFCTIVTFGLHSQIRTYPIKLIMYLCVCIVIGFTAFLIAFEPWVYNHRGVCITTAICVHYFFLANFFWTFCIAFNFYQMIVRRNREAQTLEKYYHIFCWGLPAIFVIITGSLNKYGDIGRVCYIERAIVRFFVFFLPGLFVLVQNAILFFFIGREIHETLSGAPKSDQRDKKKEFRVYLSIFISIGLSWVFGYLMYLFPFDVISDIFLILFSIFTPLQGLLIFLFYCVNEKVVQKWAYFFGICIPWCETFGDRISTRSGSMSSRSGSSRSGSGSSASLGSSSSSSGMSMG